MKLKENPKIRLPQKPKLEIPVKEIPTIELSEPSVKVRFWQKNGFKTQLGALGSVLFGILSIIPEPTFQAIGQGGLYLFGPLLVAGKAHNIVKKKKDVKEENQYQWIIELIKIIIKILTKKGK